MADALLVFGELAAGGVKFHRQAHTPLACYTPLTCYTPPSACDLPSCYAPLTQ